MAQSSTLRRIKKYIGRKLVFWQTTLNYMRWFELRYLKAANPLRPGERLLDVASGIGVFSATLGRRASRTVGIDLNRDNVRLANVLEMPRASFLTADALKLPLKSEAFEVVVSICALEHFDDDLAGLAEMYRVLKPGGRLLLTVDSLAHPLISEAFRQRHATEHYVQNFYTPVLLRERLEKVGFTVEDTTYLITSSLAVRLACAAMSLVPSPSLSRLFSVLAVPVGSAAELVAGNPERGFTLGAVAVKTDKAVKAVQAVKGNIA